MTYRRKATSKANAVTRNVRVWLQLASRTVAIEVGTPTLEDKKAVPEAWMVGHLPIHLVVGRENLCLTDLTEEELKQLETVFHAAIEAALPICRKLDEAAFEVLETGADLGAVPLRVLRGPAPQFLRNIKTEFKLDDLNTEDRETVENVLKDEAVALKTDH